MVQKRNRINVEQEPTYSTNFPISQGEIRGPRGEFQEEATESERSPSIHLRVLGARGVGKTAIVVRFLTRRFISEYRSQIDVCYRKEVTLGRKRTALQIEDFSPKSEEDLVPRVVLSAASSPFQCFLVVYNIADRISFLKAVNIVSVLRSLPENSASSAPLTLVGNKKDLDHSRQVSSEELENIATLLKCDFGEVSAAESREDVFPVILRLLRQAARGKRASRMVKTLSWSNSTSEPCLIQNENKFPETGIPVLDKLLRDNVGSNLQKSDCCTNQYVKNTQIGGLVSTPKSTSPSRISLQKNFAKVPLSRAKSLQGKYRKSRYEPKVDKFYLQSKYDQCRKLRNSSENQGKHSADPKKDSLFSNFLNCSKRNEESECMSCYVDSNLVTEALKIPASSDQVPDPVPCLQMKSPNTRFSTKISKPNKSSGLENPSRQTNNDILDFSKTREFQTTKYFPRNSITQKDDINLRKFSMSTFDDNPTVDDRRKLVLENSEDDEAYYPNKLSVKRERKFGVFGRGMFGSVLSKTSLPDLPKSSSTFYTTLDSIRRTIQKRSL